jgi:acyl-CoA synthetase (NDP forming)
LSISALADIRLNVDEAKIEQLLGEARAAQRATLSEIESKQLLEAIGIATAVAYPARSADEAAKVAARCGFPAVLKVLSPGAGHKSDVAGVVLNIRSESEAKEAFERICRNLAEKMPGARFDGVAVQRMADPGVEILAGIARDDRFGAMVMVGLGGVFVEVLKDTAARLAPVSERDARAMLAELRAAPLLHGYRGSAPVDVDSIASLIVKLSELAARRSEIAEMDLNPVVAYPKGLKVLDARVRLVAPSASPPAAPNRDRRLENLERAFNPRAVAVIGDKRASGYMWLRAMAGYAGHLYSVQIDPGEIPGIEAMGVKNYKALAEIPEPVDYAVSAVPRQVAPRIVRECIAARVGSISLFTSGFSETGEELGAKLEAELKAMVERSDIALVGPNCMGLYNPAVGLCNFPGEAIGEAGNVCFISQSGTHTINFCLQAPNRGVKVNKAASIGNATVLEAADYLDLMAGDPATRVIGMYIEGARDGRRFFDSLRRAAARHPVVVWRGGATEPGARATYSHTGALATPAAIWRAVIRQSGAVEVASFDAMLDAVEMLSRGRPVKGTGMGLVAMTGGQSVVITDAFVAAGLKVPALSSSSYEKLKGFFNIVGGSYRNPLDAGGTVGMGHSQANLDQILDILERDEAIDAIVLEMGTGLRAARWASHEEELTALLDRLAEFNRRSAKGLILVLHPAHLEMVVARARMLARERGLVSFDSFERAAAALKVAAEYYAARVAARE